MNLVSGIGLDNGMGYKVMEGEMEGVGVGSGIQSQPSLLPTSSGHG